MLLLDSSEIVRFKVLFGQMDFRHQLVGDDLQHFFQFSQIIGAEALFSALHDQVQVGIADVVVINVLLGWAQAVFAFVGSRPDALDIAFFNQRVDLIGSVGGGKVWLNCAIVGSPNAMITSMQKDSTVVSVASRSSNRLKICL